MRNERQKSWGVDEDIIKVQTIGLTKKEVEDLYRVIDRAVWLLTNDRRVAEEKAKQKEG